MTYPQPIEIQDGNQTYTIYVESDTAPTPPPDITRSGPTSREAYGLGPERGQAQQQAIKAQLHTIHHTLKAYALYALGAFQKIGGTQVEQLKLTFAVKVNTETGVPMLAKGSIGGDFTIEVICKPQSTPSTGEKQ
jgi:hypothetical protein